jgi:hypothetical protein
MREPYESLMGRYRDHWFLWPFLDGEVPDFEGISAAGPLGVLSSGEMVICNLARDIYLHSRTVAVTDLGLLDSETRRLVLDALYLTCEV